MRILMTSCMDLSYEAMNRTLIVLALAFSAVACGGAATDQTAAAPTLTVEGRAFGQTPSVGPGETFNIVNKDPSRHTFTSADGSWEEVTLAGDSTVVFTAPDAPGSYVFFCAVHPTSMGGTLTVQG
jgi:plastocyanin